MHQQTSTSMFWSGSAECDLEPRAEAYWWGVDVVGVEGGRETDEGSQSARPRRALSY